MVGFQDGWRGLLENRRIQLVNDDRNDRLLARAAPCWYRPNNPERLRAGIDEIKQTLEDNRIDVLIPIGGEGTLTAAHWLTQGRASPWWGSQDHRQRHQLHRRDVRPRHRADDRH